MKKILYILFASILALTSCDNNETESVFDKPSDVRAADAISELRSELVEPSNGWRVRYSPEDGSGAYWLLMDFNEDGTVSIKSDLSASSGEYFEQVNTYRIDNSLGLELIIESYSFFSYLFELDQATFGAEYEFIYANKTPDGALVFTSKTDLASPTILVFEPAGPDDNDLLAQTISTNLDDFTSSIRLAYDTKNVAVYMNIDRTRRTVSFNYISSKNTIADGQDLDLSTGFILQGDSIIFDDPLSITFNGTPILLKSILLTKIGEETINVCPSPTTEPTYEGFTSRNEKILIQTSLIDNSGAGFANRADIYLAPLEYIVNGDGEVMQEQITTDVTGASIMVNYNLPDFKAMGFLVENPDGTTAIVVKEYTVTTNGNVFEYTFSSQFRVIRTLDPQTNINNITPILNTLTLGGKAYAYRLTDDVYELYNPCSGWRFIFIALE